MRFDAHAAQICQSGAAAFAVEFAETAEQPFNPDEIPFRDAGVRSSTRNEASPQPSSTSSGRSFKKSLVKSTRSTIDGKSYIKLAGGCSNNGMSQGNCN